MTKSQGIQMARPAHPGSFVKHEIIEPLGLTVTEAASILHITRPALSSFLNQRSKLSQDMAVRLEKAFGIKLETLMRMQSSFDIAEAREHASEIDVAPYRPELTVKPVPAH